MAGKTYGEVIDAVNAAQSPDTMRDLATRLTAASGVPHHVYMTASGLVVHPEAYEEAMGLTRV